MPQVDPAATRADGEATPPQALLMQPSDRSNIGRRRSKHAKEQVGEEARDGVAEVRGRRDRSSEIWMNGAEARGKSEHEQWNSLLDKQL